MGLCVAGMPSNVRAAVVPPANLAVEGDGSEGAGNSAGGGIIDAASTIQFIYGSSFLSGIPIGAQIGGIQFRREGGFASTPNADVTYTNFSLTLSKSLAAPGSLSTTFASNQGPDAIEVRNGSLFVATNAYPGTLSPNAFGPVISFTTPYTYTGGDLLVTIRHTGADSNIGVQGRILDAENDPNLQYLLSTGSLSTTATVNHAYAPVANLIIPEPTGLCLLGGGALLLCRRARRARA
jgi:hypothetical protein